MYKQHKLQGSCCSLLPWPPACWRVPSGTRAPPFVVEEARVVGFGLVVHRRARGWVVVFRARPSFQVREKRLYRARAWVDHVSRPNLCQQHPPCIRKQRRQLCPPQFQVFFGDLMPSINHNHRVALPHQVIVRRPVCDVSHHYRNCARQHTFNK